MDFKKIDLNTLKGYFSPQSIKDFDSFLDNIPLNVGYNTLIAVGFMWLIAGVAVLFVSAETEKTTKINAELMQIEALQPPIPVLQYIAVDQKKLKDYADKISKTYKGLSILYRAGGEVIISSQDTDYFPQFVAAISYFQRGAKNWKVHVKNMCVGSDCKGTKLSATLKIEMVRIGDPEKK